MPIYARGKGRWLVVVHHPSAPRGRVDRIVRGRKKDARDFETRLRLELDAQGPSAVRVAPTFSDFSTTRYKLHAESELKPRTWANRKYEIAELAEFLGNLRLTEITTERVDAFRSMRAREVARRTVNRELMALSAILRYAREIGVPAASPKIRKLKVSRKRRHAEAWTAAEVEALYQACEATEPGLLPLVVFLLNTGARRSEAIALRWSEVDVRRRLVRIWPRTDDDDAFDTKNSEPREVPISDALFPFLARAPRRAEWVFPTRSKRRYAEFPKKRFARVVKAAGLEGGAHKCRHTFATHFLAQVPDLYLLGRLLGQDYAAVTEMYAHLLPDHHERARGAVSLAPTLGPSGVEARRRWGQK